MNKKINPISKILGSPVKFIIGIVLLVISIMIVSVVLATRTRQIAGQPQAITPTVAANQPELTTNWKSASYQRSGVSFAFKYPPDWNSALENCSAASTSRSFELPAGCIKTDIITEDIPSENTPPDRNIVLTSESNLTVGGYQAKRKIFSFPGEGPDTYLVWVYDKGQPIMLYIGWIGGGTDSLTRQGFVHKFDTMITTLELQKR